MFPFIITVGAAVAGGFIVHLHLMERLYRTYHEKYRVLHSQPAYDTRNWQSAYFPKPTSAFFAR